MPEQSVRVSLLHPEMIVKQKQNGTSKPGHQMVRSVTASVGKRATTPKIHTTRNRQILPVVMSIGTTTSPMPRSAPEKTSVKTNSQ